MKRKGRNLIEHDGQTYSLAKVVKGGKLPIEEKVTIAEFICMLYSTDQYTLEQCCKEVGLNVRTFRSWVTDLPDVTAVYQRADFNKSVIYRSRLRERARSTAERLMDGYKVSLKERTGEIVTDSDGNQTFKAGLVKEKEMYVRPSVKLIETVLYNFDSANFKPQARSVTNVQTNVQNNFEAPQELKDAVKTFSNEQLEDALKLLGEAFPDEIDPDNG